MCWCHPVARYFVALGSSPLSHGTNHIQRFAEISGVVDTSISENMALLWRQKEDESLPGSKGRDGERAWESLLNNHVFSSGVMNMFYN